jgi:lathosterol oxidase
MEHVLSFCENLFLDSLYRKLPEPISGFFSDQSSLQRQATSTFIIESLGGALLYLVFSTLVFFTWYDRNLLKHKKFLKNQIYREIKMSLIQVPVGAILVTPFFLLQLRGKTLVYHNVDEYGWSFIFLSILSFLVFSDFWIYWIHRCGHHPWFYSWLHKPHHTWKIPTPFSAIAFHPLVFSIWC